MEKRKKRKGMEGVCAEGKGKRRMRGGKKRGKEEEGEERRERERGTENRENGARGALPFPDAFPSAKLGNNMTPIKGRLGKKNNSHKQKPDRTKPESSEGSPTKTTRLRRFIYHRFQLRTRRIIV